MAALGQLGNAIACLCGIGAIGGAVGLTGELLAQEIDPSVTRTVCEVAAKTLQNITGGIAVMTILVGVFSLSINPLIPIILCGIIICTPTIAGIIKQCGK